ncbi:MULTISPECIES: hypothetical protein [unclassified Pseudomonas]|uniref:hypothetical protein n=1 Tax=unclassified Pseudomonas TaxID=196821 RepID=UPI00075A6FA8|nr:MULTISPECIES: hypothetical protein [unclassified Pseudomonas]KVV06788.1 hypothetical protein AP060_01400 [Pseudomonas sp. TAD18]KVV08231.1 hypothetical protein AP059_01342 [Pseudomonas sp. TAA207]
MIGNNSGIFNSVIGGSAGFVGSGENNKSEEASKKAMKLQDEAQARMTEMQSKAALSKIVTDGINAIMAGAIDSGNKASNTLSSSAKQVQY